MSSRNSKFFEKSLIFVNPAVDVVEVRKNEGLEFEVDGVEVEVVDFCSVFPCLGVGEVPAVCFCAFGEAFASETHRAFVNVAMIKQFPT